jgi:hypothetical protein
MSSIRFLKVPKLPHISEVTSKLLVGLEVSLTGAPHIKVISDTGDATDIEMEYDYDSYYLISVGGLTRAIFVAQQRGIIDPNLSYLIDEIKESLLGDSVLALPKYMCEYLP